MRYGNVFLKEIRKMTKIEKLKELGYGGNFSEFSKNSDNDENIFQCISPYEETYYVEVGKFIKTQEDIDNIQIAFNRVKSDFKEIYKK